MKKINNTVIEKEWITKSGHNVKVLFLEMGHRCGYVEVKKDSFLFNKEYSYYSFNLDDISKEMIENIEKYEAINNIEVHGGLTYAGNLLNDNSYWFGFDCAHCDDKRDIEKLKEYYPDSKYTEIFDFKDSTIKDLEFCINECELLSEQIKKIEEM